MRIRTILSSIFMKSRKNTSQVRSAISEYIMRNPQAADIKPFCQRYWENVNLRQYKRAGYKSVKYHSNLREINHHLITGIGSEDLTKPIWDLGITPKEMIKLTDAEFKTLPKTKEAIMAYRCIGEKPECLKQDFSTYLKSLEVKKGDIVTMPGYAYATSDIDYAKRYLSNDKGIMYIIEIPPESRISILGSGLNNEIAFPRSSRFECLGVEQQGEALLPKLKYIQPIDYFG